MKIPSFTEALDIAVKKKFSFIAANKERLIEAWVAETGLLPSQATLIQQDKDGVTKVWVEEKTQYCLTHQNEIKALQADLVAVQTELEKAYAAIGRLHAAKE